ncbi:hypothetical protein HYX06_05320 [Candidatus Woesearchaeota archaeon]|nr:hypothetical protein [Candidatus Woesearchaeota archaeon]
MIAEEEGKEASILMEIREAEKKAEEIIERAGLQKASIVQEARKEAARLVSSKLEEIRKSQEKKLMDFREKSRLLGEEKASEGKVMARQIKSKSDRNMQKAVDFILKKFEERM